MLTDQEIAKIRQLYDRLKSYREVANKLGHSKNTIMSVIKQQPRKPMGRPKKYTARLRRRIKRHVISELRSNRLVTSRTIKENLELDVSRRTIRRWLNRDNIFYHLIKKKLPLTLTHRQNRLNFSRRHLIAGTDFSTWIFSDEKRFCLDGPDNFGSYETEDVNLERIKRQMGGGSVMILGAISSTGKLLITECKSKYKATDYLSDLKTTFIPWAKKEMKNKKWVWQQDRAPIHTAHVVSAYFHDQNITTADWPSRSPDLSPIENVWKLMEDVIYKKGQYNTKAQLLAAIKRSTQKIKSETIKQLFLGMNKRHLEVVEAKGGQI